MPGRARFITGGKALRAVHVSPFAKLRSDTGDTHVASSPTQRAQAEDRRPKRRLTESQKRIPKNALCSICGKKLRGDEGLKQHRRDAHGEQG